MRRPVRRGMVPFITEHEGNERRVEEARTRDGEARVPSHGPTVRRERFSIVEVEWFAVGDLTFNDHGNILDTAVTGITKLRRHHAYYSSVRVIVHVSFEAGDQHRDVTELRRTETISIDCDKHRGLRNGGTARADRVNARWSVARIQ